MAIPLNRFTPSVNFGDQWYAPGDPTPYAKWDGRISYGWKSQTAQERSEPLRYYYQRIKVFASEFSQRPVWWSSRVAPLVPEFQAGMYVHSFQQAFAQPSWSSVPMWLRPHWSQLCEKLYARINNGGGDILGSTLAEADEALGGIGSAAMRFARGMQAIRTKNWNGAAEQFGVSPRRVNKVGRRWARRKESRPWLDEQVDITAPLAADLAEASAKSWLTWSFAIKPTIDSISDAAVELAHSQSEQRFKVSASIGRLKGGGWIDPGLNASLVGYHPTSWSTIEWDERVDRLRLKAGATVVITDASLYMRQVLGLTNPASWAWERMTGSFLVDWFSNVGQCISALEPWRGMYLELPWTAGFLRSIISVSYGEDWDYGPVVHYRNTYKYSGAVSFRGMFYPRPMAFYPLVSEFGDSPSRAANALSLATLSLAGAADRSRFDFYRRVAD